MILFNAFSLRGLIRHYLTVCRSAGVEVPKYVDTVTPQYKPKFEALVRAQSFFLLIVNLRIETKKKLYFKVKAGDSRRVVGSCNCFTRKS